MKHLLIVVSLFCFELKAQNLVPNPSFEDLGGFSQSYPGGYDEMYGLKYWKEFNTADWYYSSTFLGNNSYPENPVFYSTGAVTGNGFIGFGPCEGAQVKLTRKIEVGELLKLEFYYLFPKDAFDTEINVYLFKNSESTGSFSDHCNEPKIDSSFHIRININSSGFDADKVKYTWYKYEGYFPLINNNNYEWIAFKGPNIEGKSNSPRYVCIDDVSLINVCNQNIECVSTRGEILPILKQNHSETNPWSLSNIANVSNVKIEILDALGQSVITPIVKHSTNGFTKPIYWNGLNDLGSPVVTGTYMARVTLRNDCGEKQFSQQFVKTTLNTNPSVIEAQTYYVNNIKTPKQCCEYAPVFYLNNTILDGPGKLEYKVTGNIYVGANVTTTANADVLLQAGGEIIFDDGVTIGGDGSVFETELVPCVAALRPANNNVSENVFEDNINLITEINPISPISISTFTTTLQSASAEIATSEIKKQTILNKTFSSLTIYPNPNNGEFVLELSNAPNGNYTLQITDAVGRSVMQQNYAVQEQNLKQNINLQAQGKGIYFVKINSEQINEVRKVVVD